MRFHIVICLCMVAASVLLQAEPRAQEKDRQDTGVADEAADSAGAADEKPVLKDVYVIEIKDHKFSPAELVVPAGKKIKLRIVNLDPSAEEFESYDLNREKVVAGGRKITVFIGPLKPGKYSYFGEFHPETAQGIIIAK